VGTAKKTIRRRLERFLPTGVQKSYFMLSDAERTVLSNALEKYRPGRSEPIFVGGNKVLKPALRLMTLYRLVIDEIRDRQPVTSHTRWIDAVEVRGAENQEVYLTFSPRFEVAWQKWQSIKNGALADLIGSGPSEFENLDTILKTV
jgi:hypothetical protein